MFVYFYEETAKDNLNSSDNTVIQNSTLMSVLPNVIFKSFAMINQCSANMKEFSQGV